MLYSEDDNLEGIKYEIWRRLTGEYFIKDKKYKENENHKYFKKYGQALKHAESKYKRK